MLQRKTLFSSGMIVLAAFCLLFAVACDNDTTSGISHSPSQVATDGLVGHVEGVVFDSYTGQPLSGVTVEVDKKTTKTGDNGYWYIGGLIPGDDGKAGGPGVGKIVAFSLNGYRFAAQEFNIDFYNDYQELDPYNEYANVAEELTGVINALYEAAKNGVTVDSNLFLVHNYKAGTKYDRTYSLGLIGLKPLIGSVKGKIKLVTIPYTDAQNIAFTPIDGKGRIIDIEDGVNVWLYEGTPHDVLFTQNGTPAGTTVAAYYGPSATKSGAFDFAQLPVQQSLSLATRGFKNGDYYFAPGATSYRWNGTTFTTFALNASEQQPLKGGAVDVGDIYLFATANYALVVGAETGEATLINPIKADGTVGTIELTFNKAINPAGFEASLYVDAANSEGILADTILSLMVDEWSGDKKTVTLKPATRMGSFAAMRLPYSTNASLPIGRLGISGKAEDGSVIYAVATGTTNGIPVYTAEGIKLIYWELNPTNFGRAIVTTDEIMLQFNKEVHGINSRFGWDNATSTAAGFRLGNDKSIVYVKTDALLPGTDKLLYYQAYSAVDSDDVTGTGLSSIGIQLRKPSSVPLRVIETNLYTGIFGDIPSATEPHFAVDGTITFKLNAAAPAGSRLEAKLYKDIIGGLGNGLSLSQSEVSGETITIKPALPLEPGKQHWLRIEVIKEYETLLGASSVLGVEGIVVAINSNYISFTTAAVNFSSAVTILSNNNSYTSSKLDPSTFSNTPALSFGQTVTVDEAVYIQFNGSVNDNILASGTDADSTDANFRINIERVTTGSSTDKLYRYDLIKVTVVRTSTPAPGSGTYPVSLAVNRANVNVGALNSTFNITLDVLIP